MDAEVTDTLLLHYWSLSVEEQFYVLWPVLILLALRRASSRGRSPRRLAGPAVTGVLVIALASSVLRTVTLGLGAYYVTQTRLWEMAAGAALAIAVDERNGEVPVTASNALALAGLGAILAAATSFDAATPFPGYAALAPVLGTLAMLVAGANRPSAAARVLAWGPLPPLGRWSYAWYLWHWPVLGIARQVNESGAQPWPSGVVTSGAVLGSLLLAAGSHHVIENPVRHARALRTAPHRGLVLGATLMGDSHAQHWLPALAEATEHHDLRVLTWTMSACPITDTPVYEPRTSGRYLASEAWRAALLERTTELEGIGLVLVGGSFG